MHENVDLFSATQIEVKILKQSIFSSITQKRHGVPVRTWDTSNAKHNERYINTAGQDLGNSNSLGWAASVQILLMNEYYIAVLRKVVKKKCVSARNKTIEYSGKW